MASFEVTTEDPAQASVNPPQQFPRVLRLNGRTKALFETAEPSVKRPHG
jgi:hypothetical protein